jgi:hypothetical protein
MFRCSENSTSVIWDEIIQLGINNWGNKGLKGILCRLVLGFVIYHLWRTRNEIKHSGQPLTKEQLLKRILWDVRAKIIKYFKEKRETEYVQQKNAFVFNEYFLRDTYSL